MGDAPSSKLRRILQSNFAMERGGEASGNVPGFGDRCVWSATSSCGGDYIVCLASPQDVELPQVGSHQQRQNQCEMYTYIYIHTCM